MVSVKLSGRRAGRSSGIRRGRRAASASRVKKSQVSPNGRKGPSNGVAAVERALSILDALQASDGQLPLSELSQRTGLYKSTILRLINSLEMYGYIRRLENGDYQLGPKPSSLALTYQRSFRLEDFVLPTLRDLVKITRESASFYVRDGQTRICLYRIESPQNVRDHVHVGDVLPLSKGAAGRILVRFERGLAAAGKVAPQDFVAATFGERAEDTAAVAGPVFAGDGRLAGALSISGPRTRLSGSVVRVLSEAVLKASISLSAKLGASTTLFPDQTIEFE